MRGFSRTAVSHPLLSVVNSSSQANSADVNADESYHLIGRSTDRQRRRLHQSALALLVAAMIYVGLRSNATEAIHLVLGLIIMALSAWPALRWLRQGGSRFPIFEPIMLLCANSYALPLINGHEALFQYPSETITRAGLGVILYQIVAIGTYSLAGGFSGRTRFWTESILTHRIERLISYGLFLSTFYMLVAFFTDWIPRDAESVLRAVFNGISILCTFITTQRWGRGELNRVEQFVFGGLLIVQMLVMSIGLLLIAAITLCGIAMLGYLSAGRNIPWIAIGIAFACAAILHNGKSQMRGLYWGEGKPPPTITEVPSFYLHWMEYGLQNPLLTSEGETRSASSRLLERTSLMHILCLVVHYTPERQPYLAGETYGYVLPQLIPRLFWPEKPRSHIATHRLSTYYGLQEEEATYRATIAFGMPSEAYANFGFLGLAMLGAVVGYVPKKLQMLSAHSPMFSLAGIVMVLLTAWSFNAEMTLSVWVSSLFQALVVALGVPLVLRGLFGD